MKRLFSYFVSRDFRRSLLKILGLVTFFIIFVLSCVRIYTNHGKSYAVPDFSDMSIEEAIPKLEEKKMRFIVFDSSFISGKRAGVIIDQHPKAESQVKKNRMIFFTINASAPEKIKMPDLVGLTFRAAKSRMQSFGLVLGKRSYRYDISKNVVLEQKIKGEILSPGDSIPKGTSVDLVLGKGLGNEKAIVPDLIGLTVDRAKEVVSGALFSIGAVVEDASAENNSDTIKPKIFRQRPSSNPSVPASLGTAISVWVTKDTTKLPQAASDIEEEPVWPEE